MMMSSTPCHDSPSCPIVWNRGESLKPLPPTSSLTLVRALGVWIIIALKLFLLVGSSSSVSLVSCVVVVVEATSTSGAEPETVTVSCTAPTPSTTSRRAVNPTVSRIPSRRLVTNPLSSYATA